ncbi:thiamine-phosphate pyrophosphorylase, partial [bacterium]|nr:thiamine-phosphate pyrophosphorylase [bacterium]
MKIPIQYIYRILDANFNRASEGLRVVEEIARFVLGDASLVRSLKETRHSLGQMAKDIPSSLLEFRESEKDVGASLTTV